MQAVVDRVMFVGDKRMIKKEGDYYHTNSRLIIACPACREIKCISYANRFMRRKGMLLTMLIDFFCKACKFRCEIKDGDIVDKE